MRPHATPVGVPLRRPVEVLKLAQPGLFATPKRKVLPSGSEAFGRKEYCEPTYTDVAGVPEILGGRFAARARPLENRPATASNERTQAGAAGGRGRVRRLHERPSWARLCGSGTALRTPLARNNASSERSKSSAVRRYVARATKRAAFVPAVRRFALESKQFFFFVARPRAHGEASPREQSTVPPDSSLVGHRRHEACRCDGVLNSRGARS